MIVAVLRPDDWDLPVFVHVLAATVLVGALTTAGCALLPSWRRASDPPLLTRLGLWSLVAALPAWAVMRFAGQWAEARAGWDDEAAWLQVGYVTSEGGLVVLLVAAALAAVAARRARAGGSPQGLARTAAVLAIALVAAYTVTAWVMTTKPG